MFHQWSSRKQRRTQRISNFAKQKIILISIRTVNTIHVGECFCSPQKHKSLADIRNSEENQDFITKKVKITKDTPNLLSTDYTTLYDQK